MKYDQTKRKKPNVDRNTIASIMRLYWAHVRRYPGTTIIIVAAVVGIHSISVVIPLYLKKFFDTLSQPNVLPGTAYPFLLQILAIIAFFMAIRWALRMIRGWTNIYFEAYVMDDLVNTAFKNLLGHSYRFFTDNFTGSLVRKVNRLSRSFEEIADQVQGQLLPLIIIASGVLFVLFQRHVLLGSILLLWILLFMLIFYRIALWKTKYDMAKAEKDSEATGVISDALTNIITIKLFSRSRHEQSLYRKVTDELKRRRLISWRISEGLGAAQSFLMMGIELALLFSALYLWRHGKISIGDIVLLQFYLVVLFERLWEFGNVIRKIYEAFSDASEMVEIINTPYEIKDAPLAKPISVSRGKIEYMDVDFNFHGTRKILDKFNLAIRPGEKIALVGPSGAGKTTVVTLLLRFHDVDGGEILIDGQNIARVTQESLRSEVALVPQEPVLFHRTLRENIRYGRLEATDEEVVEAAKKAHCHNFVMQFPYGYNTFVGERGVKLSGGERQRVAIARAILKNAPILVLDEATS